MKYKVNAEIEVSGRGVRGKKDVRAIIQTMLNAYEQMSMTSSSAVIIVRPLEILRG